MMKMAFEITHHPTVELSVVVWRGPLLIATLKDSLAALGSAPRMRLTVWDFSDVTNVTLRAPQIESLVRETRNGSIHRPGGKTALVVPSGFLFGLARQAQTYALLTAPNPPLEIFHDRQAALSWLGLDAGPWSAHASKPARKAPH